MTVQLPAHEASQGVEARSWKLDKLSRFIYRAQDLATGEMVAMKKVSLLSEDDGVPHEALREINLLKELQHANIVTLRDVIHDERKIFIVTEWFDLDLQRYMQRCKTHMRPQLVKSYMWQLLCGLQHAHSHEVAHRGLEPKALLLDRQGVLKICNFSRARKLDPAGAPLTHEVIVLWYRAPEILLGSEQYSTAVDIWAAACIMAQMITLKPLMPGDTDIGQLFAMFKLLGTPTEQLWPGCTALPDWSSSFPQWQPKPLADAIVGLAADLLAVDLLSGMLAYSPAQRMTAAEALQHQFFDELRLMQQQGQPSVAPATVVSDEEHERQQWAARAAGRDPATRVMPRWHAPSGQLATAFTVNKAAEVVVKLNISAVV